MGQPNTDRRRFLSYCTGLLLLGIGLLVAIPAVAYVLGPLRGRRRGAADGQGLADVDRVADLPLGQWRLLPLELDRRDGWHQARARHAVWVRRTGPGLDDITVLSAVCPRLGCPIDAHPDQNRFVCPCHGATFDRNGRKVSGPSPRSMDKLLFKVRAGRLWVLWQDFRIGVAEPTPVDA